MNDQILVVNCGSSSVKMAVFNRSGESLASALAEKIGQSDARLVPEGGDTVALPPNADHRQSLIAGIQWLQDNGHLGKAPLAIGHRVVHGGEAFHQAALLNNKVIRAIEDCASLAPLHNPVNLAGIEATMELFPRVPQVAVFDTAFHQTLPRHAWLYPVPKRFYNDWGVRRYGFHGTSHQYVAEEAARRLDKPAETASVISAHLGNGCSITAIRDGRSVDTSMGLTPLEGLVMGTRSGDVDPGLFDFLASKGISPEDTHGILNRESGLLGLSGTTSDMRNLLKAARNGDRDCQDAFEVFCFRLARYIGAMMVSLDNLDALVFTGGIGENSSEVRARTVAHLALPGFRIDPDSNNDHGQARNGAISASDSRFPILVIPTREEAMIARQAVALATGEADPNQSQNH
ncbi:acetate/propionate family kinase [Marinobacter zhanjiangensis]|uniref:Acetate kinase n=1 Tax=Marinobacter zhanjiangensis TaxID=578215 RepID=A0ABQ3AU83_9GAMM|nr:acetate kinase [Marinobacter zhanjiangensis]GGY66542.1 acetate kinase [Marinobacter zhanjiangensis]